jgi:hypothetical protein
MFSESHCRKGNYRKEGEPTLHRHLGPRMFHCLSRETYMGCASSMLLELSKRMELPSTRFTHEVLEFLLC